MPVPGAEVSPALDRILTAYPPRIETDFGTTDTSRFRLLDGAALSDRPYGVADGTLVTTVASYAVPDDLDVIPATAPIVVEGEVLALGRPHFNTSDGGFWDPAFLDLEGTTPVPSVLLRDVALRIDRVWRGNEAVADGDVLAVTVPAGQALVELTPAQRATLGLPGEGPVVFQVESPRIDLTVGTRGVFLITKVWLDGFFDGALGQRLVFWPAHELYWRLSLEPDGGIVGLQGPKPSVWSEAEFRQLLETTAPVALPGGAIGTIRPAPPHPPAT
ncbi:MAG TPA: hypothetical protein ENK55_09380, partial [Actinobacteria bacterium]|nr:hypothetical protein [Actinomycetota bacterium]